MNVRLLLLLAILLFSASDVLAHSGRTDACGGHNDRKRGGYHIHNYSKYCACYPDAPECKKEKDSIEKDSIKREKIKKNKEE